MNLFQRAWTVLWKDLRIEGRNREGLNTLLFFGAILLFLFHFALGPDRTQIGAAAGGLLWLGFILMGLFAMARTFQVEREEDCLEGLRLLPGDPGAIYLGKVLWAVVLLGAAELVTFLLFGLLFNVDLWGRLLSLLGVAVLGTVGIAAVGVLFAAMAAHLRAREAMLPLLLFPLLIPLMLAAVQLTQVILDGGSLLEQTHWIRLLAVFDTIFLVVGFLTFTFVLEE
ncbi:MAG: heme exporter protein CcmB [Candidatus Methylomirabilales bacterium]